VLDTDVDDELEAEGLARDAVREIQQARRQAGLHVADRVAVHLVAPASMADAVERHGAYVREQTLAEELTVERGQALAVTVHRLR
jgi:isoleucyl-tRNA synthetase